MLNYKYIFLFSAFNFVLSSSSYARGGPGSTVVLHQSLSSTSSGALALPRLAPIPPTQAMAPLEPSIAGLISRSIRLPILNLRQAAEATSMIPRALRIVPGIMGVIQGYIDLGSTRPSSSPEDAEATHQLERALAIPRGYPSPGSYYNERLRVQGLPLVTTLPTRYPHLLLHLERVEDRIPPSQRAGRTIIHLGPGLDIPPGEGYSIPFVHETMPFFIRDSVLLVDRDANIGLAMRVSRYPARLSSLILVDQNNFADVTEQRRVMAFVRNQVEDRLPLSLEFARSTFESHPMRAESADVIFGLLSVVYALNHQLGSVKISLFKKILLALKRGGRLYIDSQAYELFKMILSSSLQASLASGNMVVPFEGATFRISIIRSTSKLTNSRYPSIKEIRPSRASVGTATYDVVEFTRE